MGHEVCAVWSAEDAKAALSTFNPDVALLDVRLPGMPGDAFAVYLKHKFPTIKIVFVSGEFRLDDPERFGPEVDFLPSLWISPGCYMPFKINADLNGF